MLRTVPRIGPVPALAGQDDPDYCGRGSCLAGLLSLPSVRRWTDPAGCPTGPEHLRSSRGAAQAIALTGTLSSFAEAAAKVLTTLTGLRVSESTVERTT